MGREWEKAQDFALVDGFDTDNVIITTASKNDHAKMDNEKKRMGRGEKRYQWRRDRQ